MQELRWLHPPNSGSPANDYFKPQYCSMSPSPSLKLGESMKTGTFYHKPEKLGTPTTANTYSVMIFRHNSPIDCSIKMQNFGAS